MVVYSSVSRFRTQRGRRLRRLIAQLAEDLGRDITILDLGGRPGYWRNVGLENIARIELLNIEAAELGDPGRERAIYWCPRCQPRPQP